MLAGDLSACELQTFNRGFGKSCRIRRRVRILDLDHNLVEDVTDRFLDGQVNVDADARSATVSLFDPTHSVGFDTDNPARGTITPKYLLALSRGVFSNDLDRWVDFRVGTLWLTKPEREGDVLFLEAQSKHQLVSKPAAKQLKWNAGTKKTTVVREIMESVGETRFLIDPSSARLSETFTLGVDKSPWDAVKRIAESMSADCFYDAHGRLVLRNRSRSAVFTFRMGDGGTLLTDPRFTYDDGDVFNQVVATGGTPKGHKSPIVKSARVSTNHPLYLKRGGKFVPQIYPVSNDKLLTGAEVQAFADEQLAQVVLDTQTATWDSLPVWNLEPFDVVRLTDALDDHGAGASFSDTVRLRSFSVPLGLGVQSNGYTRRVARSKSKLRRAA